MQSKLQNEENSSAEQVGEAPEGPGRGRGRGPGGGARAAGAGRGPGAGPDRWAGPWGRRGGPSSAPSRSTRPLGARVRVSLDAAVAPECSAGVQTGVLPAGLLFKRWTQRGGPGSPRAPGSEAPRQAGARRPHLPGPAPAPHPTSGQAPCSARPPSIGKAGEAEKLELCPETQPKRKLGAAPGLRPRGSPATEPPSRAVLAASELWPGPPHRHLARALLRPMTPQAPEAPKGCASQDDAFWGERVLETRG